MDAELVGAACERIKEQVGSPVWVFGKNLVLCVCGFTLLKVNLLSRPFVIISREGQIYPAVCVDGAEIPEGAP